MLKQDGRNMFPSKAYDLYSYGIFTKFEVSSKDSSDEAHLQFDQKVVSYTIKLMLFSCLIVYFALMVTMMTQRVYY